MINSQISQNRLNRMGPETPIPMDKRPGRPVKGFPKNRSLWEGFLIFRYGIRVRIEQLLRTSFNVTGHIQVSPKRS